MNKRVCLILIVTISLGMLLVICSKLNLKRNSEEESIDGRWIHSSGEYIEFMADGTFESNLEYLKYVNSMWTYINGPYGGTFSNDENSITLTYSSTDGAKKENRKVYQYSINDGVLSLENSEETITLTKE